MATSCTGAGGHVGQKYSYAQLQALWINAGGPPAVAPIAAAIALAESGGCSAALNGAADGGKSASWGLWQITDGTHAQPVANVMDPTVNAAAAVAQYRAGNNSFGTWGTYSSGAYRGYVKTSTTPDYTGVPTNTAGTPSSSNGSGSSSMPDGSTAIGGALADPCLFGIPPISLSFAPDFPGLCLIKRDQAKQLLGGMLMVGGALVALAGIAIIVAGAAGSRAAGPVGTIVSAVAK